jgi:hypothetical protein
MAKFKSKKKSKNQNTRVKEKVNVHCPCDPPSMCWHSNGFDDCCVRETIRAVLISDWFVVNRHWRSRTSYPLTKPCRTLCICFFPCLPFFSLLTYLLTHMHVCRSVIPQVKVKKVWTFCPHSHFSNNAFFAPYPRPVSIELCHSRLSLAYIIFSKAVWHDITSSRLWLGGSWSVYDGHGCGSCRHHWADAARQRRWWW